MPLFFDVEIEPTINIGLPWRLTIVISERIGLSIVQNSSTIYLSFVFCYTSMRSIN